MPYLELDDTTPKIKSLRNSKTNEEIQKINIEIEKLDNDFSRKMKVLRELHSKKALPLFEKREEIERQMDESESATRQANRLTSEIAYVTKLVEGTIESLEKSENTLVQKFINILKNRQTENDISTSSHN